MCKIKNLRQNVLRTYIHEIVEQKRNYAQLSFYAIIAAEAVEKLILNKFQVMILKYHIFKFHHLMYLKYPEFIYFLIVGGIE